MIFGDLKTAMTLSLSRFDEGTREAFFDFYNKVAEPVADANAKANSTAKSDADCPFA